MATGGDGRVNFVAKRCELEIESVLSVNVASQKMPKSGRVVSKVYFFGT